jgi:hypothetical protein
MTDDLREVERVIAAAMKPYTEYLVQQGHLTGFGDDTWHLWLARRCAGEVTAALRQVEQRAYERAAEVAEGYPASGGYRQIGRNIATAIRRAAPALIRDTKGEG